MPFIGKQPQAGAYSKLDAITTSATATYNLTLGGSAYFPSSANHLLVSLNGVLQAPQDSFTVSGSQITFASALTSADSIDFIMALGDVLDIGTPSAGATVPGAFNVAGDLTVNNSSTSKIKLTNPNSIRNNYVGIVSTDNIEIAADEDDEGDDSTIRFRIDGAEAARFRPTSSGYGITFNGDNTDATTLDDYEEGTWTPTFVGASGSITIGGYDIQEGLYTKIGNVVYIQGGLRTTSVSGVSSGTYDIAGLPFTVKDPSQGSSGIIFCDSQQDWTNAPRQFTTIDNGTTMRARQGLAHGASTYTNGNTVDFRTDSGSRNRVYWSGWYLTDE